MHARGSAGSYCMGGKVTAAASRAVWPMPAAVLLTGKRFLNSGFLPLRYWYSTLAMIPPLPRTTMGTKVKFCA